MDFIFTLRVQRMFSLPEDLHPRKGNLGNSEVVYFIRETG